MNARYRSPTRRIANQNPYHRARSMPSHRPPPPPDYLDYLMAEDRYYHRYYAAQALSQGHQHQPEAPSAFGRRINTPLYYQPQQRPPPPPSVPMCHHITAKQPPKPKPVVHTLKNSASCQPPKPLKLDPEMPSLEPRPLLPTHQHLSAAQQRCQPVKEPKFVVAMVDEFHAKQTCVHQSQPVVQQKKVVVQQQPRKLTLHERFKLRDF